MLESTRKSGGGMLAVDTNVVVRFLMADDPRQSATAQFVFDSQEVWIAKTVLLETEWVLRRSYKMDRASVRTALMGLMSLPNVHVENPAQVTFAFDLAASGMDFADALHTSSKPASSRFLTFDKDLARAAHKAGLAGVDEA